MIRTNGRTTVAYPAPTGTLAAKWPPHAQWARPVGDGLYKNYSVIITTATAATAIPSPCRRVGRSRSIHAAIKIVDAG